MGIFKNPEFFKVGNEKTVTVSVTFDVDPKMKDRTILLNAAEALKFYANNEQHKSWERKIEVK